MFVEMSEDTTVTVQYTYTTREQDGVRLGYYLEGSEGRTEEELAAAADGSEIK